MSTHFKRDHIILSFVIVVITVMLLTTLIPLFLMFYTSIKPSGTLKKQETEILVADFDKGETNSIGGVIAKDVAGDSTLDFTFAGPDQKGGRYLEVTFNDLEDSTRVWTRITQDLRRFSSLEFSIRTNDGFPRFMLEFEDIDGNVIRFQDVKKYVVSSYGAWTHVRIPVKDLNINILNPKYSSKTAEVMAFRFPRESKGTLGIDNIRFILKKYTFANYLDVLISGPFGRYFFNSSVIAIVITLGNLLFSSMVGYAFARKDFPAKNFMFVLILGSIMIPPQVLMVPVFILMKNIGWLNTYPALIVPTLVSPFNIFMMRQYISKLPSSIEDAARIDGATDFQIFFRVIMPLSKPALAVVGINTFMGAWNTFLYPFLLTNTANMRTLPVGLALYKSLQGVDWVHLMAASSITAVPIIVVFLCFQRYIIAGLTAGSSK